MTTTIFIQNLKCGGCAATIERALRKFPEVFDVKIDFETSGVSIETSQPDPERYADALRSIGYPPIGDDNSLFDKAQSLISCAVGKLSL